MSVVEPASSQAFLDDVRLVTLRLRRAIVALIQSTGADPGQPQEVSRRFSLDKTLAWKLARSVRAEDTQELVAHLPRRPSMQIFVRAMQRHGADKALTDEAWASFDLFEELVERHSGDRETFEVMVASPESPRPNKRAETLRKSAYQGNSSIWGVHARVQIAMHILTPSETPGHVDLATVCGLVDFRRLRANVPWAIASLSAWDRDQHDAPRAGPLSGNGGEMTADAFLLHQFSSDPPPPMRTSPAPGGVVRIELTEGPVGKLAAATVMLGWRSRAVGTIRPTHQGEMGEHGVLISTPCELLIHDLLVHRSLSFVGTPTAHVYSQLPGGPRYPQDGGGAGLLPMHGEVVSLGTGPVDCMLPEFPRYAPMAEHALKAMGYVARDMVGHRYRLAYPPVPSMMVFRHPLAST